MMLFIPVTDNWMEKLNTKLIDTSFSSYISIYIFKVCWHQQSRFQLLNV